MPSPKTPPPDTALNAIDAGLLLVEEVGGKNREDRLEEQRIEEARLKNELQRAHIESMNADRDMRKTYASRILRYLETYSGVVGILVIWSGLGWFGFNLPAEILATLVGSTAVAAIGLVGFIARGLFKPPSH